MNWHVVKLRTEFTCPLQDSYQISEDSNDKRVQHSQEEGRQSALNALSLIDSCYLNDVKGMFLKECG